MNRAKIKEELKAIQGRREMLPAQAVVVWAKKHPQSELYRHFEWNDGKAAAAYRMMQARELIKIVIVSEPSTPQWLSLSIDRASDGGYRDSYAVYRTPRLREILVKDVLAEFKRIRERHSGLHELADLYTAIDEAINRTEPDTSMHGAAGNAAIAAA